MRPLPLFVALGCLGLLLAAGGPACAEDRPTQPGALDVSAFDQALARLSRPLLRERREGVRELVGLLPAARPRVIAALATAPWTVQLHLIQVLAEDGSPAALDALLEHHQRTDATQAAAIQMALVADEVASARLLETFRADGGALLRGERPGLERLRTLESLLVRAEIEQKLLSRKSKTGSTGYYKGQYELLDYERERALEVCVRIAMDEAFPTPGVYRTGPYRFLRPQIYDYWEVRAMAMNAVSELARPSDAHLLTRLEVHAMRMHRRCIEMQTRLMRPFSTPRLTWEEREELRDDLLDQLGRWGDAITALYIVDKDEYRGLIEQYLRELTGWGIREYWTVSLRASLLIRVGMYEEAIGAYWQVLTQREFGKATAHYNLACAYASWSLSPGSEDAAQLQRMALEHLRRAVEDHGWSDVGWMNEDRDLDPIREEPEYARLIEKIRRESLPPGDPERPK